MARGNLHWRVAFECKHHRKGCSYKVRILLSEMHLMEIVVVCLFVCFLTPVSIWNVSVA